MQEGNLAAGGDGICDFMHGVGAQDNAFGPRLLQPDRGLSKDLPGAIPVAGGLAGFDVVKIDAVQHQAGRVQAAQSRLNALIDQPIIGIVDSQLMPPNRPMVFIFCSLCRFCQ